MNKFSVSFMMPMYNERDNIQNAVREIEKIARELTGDYEIVIVDDASTDDSASIVEKITKENDKVKLFRLKENSKFGGAFAEGMKRATKEVILYMDSDLPVEPRDIMESFPMIAESDVVSGYSKIKKGDTLKRKFISGVYNFIVRVLFGLNLRDINSGYKIVKRRVVEGAEFISRSPFVDVELFLHAKKRKCTIQQYPLIFRTRQGGKSYISRLPIILATFRDMFKVKLRNL